MAVSKNSKQPDSLAAPTKTAELTAASNRIRRVKKSPALQTAANEKGKKRAIDEFPVTDVPDVAIPSMYADSPPKKAKGKPRMAPTPATTRKRKKPWLDEAPTEHNNRLSRIAKTQYRPFKYFLGLARLIKEIIACSLLGTR